ncbi:hypothetical protein [Pelistega suis]|uniref:Uncharacterized protein n=2 Tax=Pelistega suis TaxID=1631957 RepID=A0A849PBA8_9BURK|nr:hypothetical protein [Pelistega suis]NOL52187.1 hypothetical protein [Pelistega suis]
MIRPILTFEKAKEEFDHIVTDFSQLQEKEIAYIESHGGWELSDTQLLKGGGKEWIIEPLRELQPLSYQVLKEHASEYMVGFYWFRPVPHPACPLSNMGHAGFLVVKDRVIWVRAHAQEIITGSINYFHPSIRESWLKRAGLWGVSPSVAAWYPRMLVGGARFYLSFENYAELADRRWKKTILPILEEKIPQLYNDGWPTFRCFLDSSLPDDGSTIGDQLYILEEDPEKRVYWVKDCNFKQMYYLENPGEAIDAYSAHTLLQKEGRFDFSPWAKPW